MTRVIFVIAILLLVACSTYAQEPSEPVSVKTKLIHAAEAMYEVFGKPVHPTLEPIAPTGGLTGGIAVTPRPWRNESRITTVVTRASASVRKYWAIDGSIAWQQSNSWRLEPYVRLREMKRLNYFGVGNDSARSDRADFSLLERRVGAYGWKRPVPWVALGGRAEVLSPRTSSGEDPDLLSVEERFSPSSIPGFGDDADYVHAQVFANLNYPTGLNERPRRGGDYRIALGRFHALSGSASSFQRLELEGQERFTVFGPDRQLTLHGLVSAAYLPHDESVPFYLMDTLGGADNLRGFREDIIGSDQTTATLRSFESFRFRGASSALMQVELRQRLWTQLFVSVFVDAGTVAPTFGDLASTKLHKGAGVALSLYRANIMAIRADFSLWGGEGHPHFITPGKAFGF